MSECNLDHSQEDVLKKLESQKTFLTADLYKGLVKYLQEEHTQDMLNELFHLLKKYDLVTDKERDARNNRLQMIILN